MKALIIILIVCLIVQTVVYIYAQFIDSFHRKQLSSLEDQYKESLKVFAIEKKEFYRILSEKDVTISRLLNRISILTEENKNSIKGERKEAEK